MRHSLLTVLVMFVVLAGPAAAQDWMIPADDGTVPGVVIVKLRADAAGKAALATPDALAEHLGASSATRAFPMLDAVAAKGSAGAIGLDRVFYVLYAGPEHPRRVAARYAADPDVEYAEPYFVHRTTGFVPVTPNDPTYGEMSYLPRSAFPEAWDVVKGESASPAPVIAIVDGGTDWRHPDLQANIWSNPNEVASNGVDDDDNGFVDDVRGWNFQTDTNDPKGQTATPENASHGTGVAGVAGAVTDNGVGVAGSSWNADIMPVNVSCPTTDSSLCYSYTGLLYAALTGADFINASFSSPDYSQTGQDIINFVVEQGALVVAAASNDGNNADLRPAYPANYIGVLSVGATAKDSDVVATFSNYGRSVGVFAAGSQLNTTLPNSQYGMMSGTSLASPLVAGLGGLVKAAFPELSPRQIGEQIRVTADNIDEENPFKAGKLGRGRINAHRAVTDRSIPAIRLDGFTFTETDGDGLIEGSESVQLTLSYHNYLADATDVTVVASTLDNLITITSQPDVVPSMAGGSTVDVVLTFDVDENLSPNRILRFDLDVTSGAYADAEIISITAAQEGVAGHNTGVLLTSITGEGNIGFTEFGDGNPESRGAGFSLVGRANVMFEGGLMIGTGPARVSDSVRGTDQDAHTQWHDFTLRPETRIEVVSPGEFATQEGRVELIECTTELDAACTNTAPVGVDVLQETYADKTDGRANFVIFRYTFTNTTAATLDNFHAGLFFDWDVNVSSASNDLSGFDAARRTGWVKDGASETMVAAARLLTTSAPLAYAAVNNDPVVYSTFDKATKWGFLSGGVQGTEVGPADLSQIIGSGPYTIPAGETVSMAIALIAAGSEEDLLTYSDQAQTFWDGTINHVPSANEDFEPLPEAFDLGAAYPNPAAGLVNIDYRVSEPATVEIAVFDLLGRRVRSLVSTQRSPGMYTVSWDGRDASGRSLPGGMYLYRMTAGNGAGAYSAVHTLVLVR